MRRPSFGRRFVNFFFIFVALVLFFHFHFRLDSIRNDGARGVYCRRKWAAIVCSPVAPAMKRRSFLSLSLSLSRRSSTEEEEKRIVYRFLKKRRARIRNLAARKKRVIDGARAASRRRDAPSTTPLVGGDVTAPAARDVTGLRRGSAAMTSSRGRSLFRLRRVLQSRRRRCRRCPTRTEAEPICFFFYSSSFLLLLLLLLLLSSSSSSLFLFFVSCSVFSLVNALEPVAEKKTMTKKEEQKG